ncbi:MAG: hypothetical protein ACK503_14740 [Labrys sp. (in: a-proteobacteria)]
MEARGRAASLPSSYTTRWDTTLDRSDRDLFSHVFTDEECRFENGSASVCEIEIKARSSDYARLVDGFKRAKLARFTVEEAGVMKMDYAVTLVGFTRALR